MKMWFVVFSLLASPCFAAQEIGNCAGGVVEGSEVATFFSAGISLQKSSLQYEEIPGLDDLIHSIQSMPLSNGAKLSLMHLAIPSDPQRTYFKMANDVLDQEFRQQMLDQYSRITGLPSSKLVIFAVTNFQGQTLLLPEFFRLKKVEQQAILFHELLWVQNSRLSYTDVVRTEMAAQNYFVNGATDRNAYLQFFLLLSSIFNDVIVQPDFIFQPTLSYEQNRSGNKLELSALLTSAFASCYEQRRWNEQSSAASCTASSKEHLW